MNCNQIITKLKSLKNLENVAGMARWIASDAVRELTSKSVQDKLLK